jgi:hypothetical protein
MLGVEFERNDILGIKVLNRVEFVDFYLYLRIDFCL